MKRIGVAKEGQEIMENKAKFFILKLENIPIKDAIILKQESLSLGMDCAVSWNVVSLKTEKTDALLFGTKKQFDFLSKKMFVQPFNGREISEEINEAISNFENDHYVWRFRDDSLDLSKVRIMGILNVTPDSFSDGGMYMKRERALEHAKKMVEEGADIIDIGAESTRPGSRPIDSKEEISRLSPVIDDITSLPVPVSVDTYKPDVAEFALEHGAKIINDIYGLGKEGMLDVVKRYNAGIIIMHMKGEPSTMQQNPTYENVTSEIIYFLRERTLYAIGNGIRKENIAIDPGIGFGKRIEHNIKILRELQSFKSLGFPIVVGVSRKGFIGEILGKDVNERLIGSIASALFAITNGASVIRAHDVKETKEAIRMLEALRG
ncbi:MAG: dihydropteroate synthase [Euryarchaeota archaeon]|nr:dihydropteroate synthase [Euryarchaeota archaeon]MVT36037.1 dihydropteroate synthase [Euryarchaeota archaeon]